MRQPPVPYLEPIAGAAWWTVGAAALEPGVATVVLAAGLGVAGGMLVALRQRHGSGAPLGPGVRGRLLRLIGVTAALVAVAGTLLGTWGWGELSVPLACAVVGGVLIPVSSMLDERSLIVAGGALLLLGAAGALLALDSAGRLYPQGVVGLVAGAVLWVTGTYRGGLISELARR